MPRLDYETDKNADERLNPASELSARELAAFDQIAAGLRDDAEANPEQNSSANSIVKHKEDNNSNFTYKGNGSGDGKYGNENHIDKKRFGKVLGIIKKRGAAMGLVSAFGITGAILAAILAPSVMLNHLMENFTNGNDSSSTVFQSRLTKILGYMTSDEDTQALCNKSSKLRCKMGRISNHALRQMAKKGVFGIDKDGNKMDLSNLKRTGYPESNPKEYVIEMDGESHRIKAGELQDFLTRKENRKLAARLIGTGGAFNMRFRAWAGKHITQKFFKKFGINKHGGIAAEENRKASVKDKIKNFRSKIPGSDAIANAAEGIKKRVNNSAEKAKKGGLAYMTAVSGCILVKAPSYIAAGVAAVQLAQIMPFVMDIVLSPGSAAKGSGVLNSFTPEDAEATGTLLTERTKRQSDEKLTSALDSKYLLAAIGVNKNKLAVSKDFTPGYSVLTSDIVKASQDASEKSESTCNAIMSPAAMYTAMGVNAAVQIAASATIIGGVVKLVAEWAASEVIQRVVAAVVGDSVVALLTDVAKNTKIPEARGEELGDVIGIGAAAFFSAGGAANYLPVLKKSQLAEYDNIRIANEGFRRDMDVASLSPLDISSPYTFLGSITRSFGNTVLANGGYSNPLLQIAQSTISLPMKALSFTPITNAASNFKTAQYCDYATDFNIDTDNGDPPAINMSGLPCTGATSEQINMDTDQAIQLIENEDGWVDNSKEISENATVDELISSGFFPENGAIANILSSCSNTETGDYLFNAAGCTVDESAAGQKVEISGDATSCTTVTKEDENGQTITEDICPSSQFTDSAEAGVADGPPSVKNKNSVAAINVVMWDYIIAQSINGHNEDDTSESGGTGSSSSETIDSPSKDGWSHPMPGSTVSFDYKAVGRKGVHKGIDFIYGTQSFGKPVYSAHDGTVTKSYDMGSCGWATVISADGVNGIWHAYQHMDPIVKQGDVVKRGQKIGTVGRFCGTAYHLHFSIETANRVSSYADTGANDTSRNPRDYLPL